MPVKSNGDISETFSTAKKDTDKMLSTCKSNPKHRALILSSCNLWKISVKRDTFLKRNLTVPITVWGLENL